MHSEGNCRLFISLDIVKLPPKDIEYKIAPRRTDKSRNCAGENISVYTIPILYDATSLCIYTR